MKIVILSWTGFLPMAVAASSCSRIARRLRPKGELTILEATSQTSSTHGTVKPTYMYWKLSENWSTWPANGPGTREIPAAPFRNGRTLVITEFAITERTSREVAREEVLAVPRT